MRNRIRKCGGGSRNDFLKCASNINSYLLLQPYAKIATIQDNKEKNFNKMPIPLSYQINYFKYKSNPQIIVITESIEGNRHVKS